MIKLEIDSFGRIAFYVGLAIAIIAGFFNIGSAGLLVLGLLGLLVGLLNVTGSEVHNFLLATLVLVITGLAVKDLFGGTISNIISAYLAFTAASAFIVALREVYSIQKSK